MDSTIPPSATWTSSDESSDSDDDDNAIVTLGMSNEVLSVGLADGNVPQSSGSRQTQPWGGSTAGKKPNKKRKFAATMTHFNDMYFDNEHVYDERDFENVFRMPRRLFERICGDLIGHGIFVHRRDALGKGGIHPKMRIIASLRLLAYGYAFKTTDELCCMSEASSMLSFKNFVKDIVRMYGAEYLRSPNESDLRRILSINAARGFPGCLGSWDCQHWEWKNCPVGWAGQFKGKEKKPTVVLEAIADSELWIWGMNFGSAGSLNDINILDASSIVQKILEGEMLPGFSYEINGRQRRLCYYNVDGIYPNWAIFVKTIAEALERKHKMFASAQEGFRKDVERAFGVLVSRWHILRAPCRLWDKSMMLDTMKACVILHNMIVEMRRDDYASELWTLSVSAIGRRAVIDGDGNEIPFQWSTSPSTITDLNSSGIMSSWASQVAKRETEITDELEHFTLKADLIEHIWKRSQQT